MFNIKITQQLAAQACLNTKSKAIFFAFNYLETIILNS